MRPWIYRFIAPSEWPLIGGVDLSTPAYFFFLTLGFLLATNIVVREAQRSREDVRDMLDLAILMLVGGLVGARLGHILFEMPGYYWKHPGYMFQFWRGGLVYYGGLLFNLVIALLYCRRRGLDFWRVGDIFAPAVSFGLIFGRMGCLSAGCCYGKPADFPFGLKVPWSVTFYHGQVPVDLRGVPLHPTQIYEALSCLLLYLYLVRLRKKQKYDGQVFWTFLVIYSILRSVIEAFRFDLDRVVYFDGWISTSQIISLGILIAAAIVMPKLARRARRNGSYGKGPAWIAEVSDPPGGESLVEG